MDWTAGYTSDVEYTAGFYGEQSPVLLNFVCVLNGFKPVPLDRPFTYCELGFGRGVTVNILAACHPQGRFYATDFNPAHVAGARELAAEAQLDNLTLLENSFADLAEGKVADLPQFDFITLHGIYTWVTRENRRYIVDFIARYLKPGGIVYLSYNAMPGWSAALPLQRLLVEHASLFPGRSDVQIKQAAALAEQLSETKAAYFNANPSLKTRLDMLKKGSTRYLVHEYMHRHWEPLYHADVARDLSAAKLEFVGQTDLALTYPAVYLSPEKQKLLDDIPDAILRESFKDYFLNTGFRKDVFVRGARRINVAQQVECLHGAGLALVIPRADVKLKMDLAFGEANGKEELYNPILDELVKQPQTFKALCALPALKEQPLQNIIQMGAFLTASAQTSIYFSDGRPVNLEAGQRLNRVLAQHARYVDDYQALAAPLLGNGVTANFVEQLIYSELVQRPDELEAEAIGRRIWPSIRAQGKQMRNKEGKAIETEEENLKELVKQVALILDRKLPVWRQLQVI